MIRIAVGNNVFATVDDCDWDLAFYNWSLDNDGYAHAHVLDKTQHMHRLIGERMGLSQAQRIDHIDRDRLNNKRNNLRAATHQQDLINRYLNNKHKFTGVWKNGNRYSAHIRINGKQTHLGTFDTPEEAHEAYIKACKSQYGDHVP